MAEINEFDDYLKDALSNLGEDISPGDWSSFAEKLHAADGLSTETTPDFDDLIRNQMESLEVNADANYWEAMESKIDQEINAPQISDEALDQLATDQLSNLYIPYNPTHWTLLSHRLEEEFNVRRKIVSYKLVEFSLMVLLLLTIVQFMPDYSNIQAKDNAVTETQEKLAEVRMDANKNATPYSNKNIISAVITEQTITANDELPATKTAISEISDKSTTPPVDLNTSSEIINLDKSEKKHIIKKETTTSLPTEEEEAQTLAGPVASSLTELPVDVSLLNYNTDWSAIGLLKKFPKKVMVRLGAMTSADLNYIKTPSTSSYKNNGYQQYQLGYGGGIVLDLNYEKLTLSTGLIYRRIKYYPQEEINIAGSFANGYQSHVFDAVNLNLLTIPMNLQFRINDPDKKWKLHAVTGASLNVLALNHYNITINNIGNSPSTVGFVGPTPQGSPPPNTPDNEIFREADIAGEGLFEGGTFERNHYFTANLGIGVERFISPRWSLFVQPVYQHEIFGKNLGLNRDRIHTFSVQIGAKSTFK